MTDQHRGDAEAALLNAEGAASQDALGLANTEAAIAQAHALIALTEQVARLVDLMSPRPTPGLRPVHTPDGAA